MRAQLAVLLFSAAAGAAAQESSPASPTPAPIGLDAVWAPPADFLAKMHKACDKSPPGRFGECFVSRMQKADAPPPAVAFARRTGNQGYLRAYRDTGKVDVAQAEYPFRANQNQVCFLVNGDPSMLDVDDPKWMGADALAANTTYADLLKRFPKIAVFPGTRFGVTSPGAVNLKNGGQRFVVDFLLKDGCHACVTVGAVKLNFDFDVNGQFVETKVASVRSRR